MARAGSARIDIAFKAGLLAAACAMCGAAPAQPVAPGLVVPKAPAAFGRVTPRAEAAPSAPAPPAPATNGALQVTLGAVSADGAFDDLKDALDALWSRLRGRAVTLAEIQQAIDAYQQAYEARGYLLARVLTPPQALHNGGVLKLVVIDGFVESVETGGLPERLRAPVADRLAPIVGVKHLQSGTLERQLMLLANLPGVHMHSALARGTQRGGVRLIVDGLYDPTLGSVQFDNRLPRALGTWEGNVSLEVNQALGFGEKLYASAVSSLPPGSGRASVHTLLAGGALPLGIDGFTANLELTDSRSRQAAQAEVPATLGHFRRTALRASYPWELSRHLRWDLRASLERVEQSMVAPDFALVLNRDAYRVVRLGSEVGLLQADGSSYQAAAFFSHGISGRDEADVQASGVPLSRIGASSRLSKFDFSLQWSRPLGAGLQASVVAHGQFAGGKPLMKSEQLPLEGGADILSYPEGSFAVDSGAAARGELDRFFITPLGPLSAGLFAAFGAGTVARPSAVEKASVHAASLGVSLGSVAGDSPGPWKTYFHVDAALRGSNDTRAGKGFALIATIGVKW